MYIECVISRGKGFGVSRRCLYKMQQAEGNSPRFSVPMETEISTTIDQSINQSIYLANCATT